jgi:hypothetical protein
MPDEETMDVGQDVQEVVQPTDSVQQSERQEEAQVVQQQKRNDAEYNWAETRRKMDMLERENREHKEMLLKLQQKQLPPEEDELEGLADDDILTVSQARKLAQKISRQTAQESYRERDAATVDDRMRSKFSDYDDIVTSENLELLKKNDPELAMSLQRLADDPYSQSMAAYKMLKRAGYSPQKQSQTLEKRKALENSQKPMSVNSVSKQSSIGNVASFENGLTPDLKKQMWAEMQQAMKG